jgi:hypothetical protein
MNNFCIHSDDIEGIGDKCIDVWSDEKDLEQLAAMIADYTVTPLNHKEYEREWPAYEPSEGPLYILPIGYKDIVLGWVEEYKNSDVMIDCGYDNHGGYIA